MPDEMVEVEIDVKFKTVINDGTEDAPRERDNWFYPGMRATITREQADAWGPNGLNYVHPL